MFDIQMVSVVGGIKMISTVPKKLFGNIKLGCSISDEKHYLYIKRLITCWVHEERSHHRHHCCHLEVDRQVRVGLLLVEHFLVGHFRVEVRDLLVRRVPYRTVPETTRLVKTKVLVVKVAP